MVGGVRYVVFRIPGVGEEVCRVFKNSITVGRLLWMLSRIIRGGLC